MTITISDLARAERYKMWCNGNAYIPIQDLIIYEKSYRKVNSLT